MPGRGRTSSTGCGRLQDRRAQRVRSTRRTARAEQVDDLLVVGGQPCTEVGLYGGPVDAGSGCRFPACDDAQLLGPGCALRKACGRGVLAVSDHGDRTRAVRRGDQAAPDPAVPVAPTPHLQQFPRAEGLDQRQAGAFGQRRIDEPARCQVPMLSRPRTDCRDKCVQVRTLGVLHDDGSVPIRGMPLDSAPDRVDECTGLHGRKPSPCH